jgi:TolA-binding protein
MESRSIRAVLAAVALALVPSATRAQGTPVERLQKELESLRKQMQQMQKRLDEQDAVIRKLSNEPAAPPPPVAAPATPPGTPPAVSTASWTPDGRPRTT